MLYGLLDMDAVVPSWVIPGALIDLNFAAGLYYPSQPVTNFISCSRASNGYATNTSGTLLTNSGNNVLRIGIGNGLLIEEARTNLCLQSQTATNASWIKSGSTATDNALAAPDGTLTAATLSETGATSVHQISQVFTSASAATYSLSVYAKAGSLNYLNITWTSNASANNFIQSIFDLNLGVLGESTTGATSGTIFARNITSIGSGWYRCSLAGSITATDGTFVLGGALAASGNSYDTFGQCSYLGASRTSIFYIWGMQLEQAQFSTSYIPTTAASASRSQDTVTGSSLILNAYTASGGAIFSKLVTHPIASVGSVFAFNDNSTNNRVDLRCNQVGAITTFFSVGGSGTLNVQFGSISETNVLIRTGLAYSPTRGALFDSTGRSGIGSGSNLIPAAGAINTAYVGLIDSGVLALDNYIQRLTFFNFVPSDAQMVILAGML